MMYDFQNGRISNQFVDPKDGQMLVKDCILTMEGVAEYLGHELGSKAADVSPDQKYTVFRPASVLEEAAHTFRGKPVVWDHIEVMAAQPPKDRIVGAICSEPYVKDGKLFADINFIDGRAINAIRNHERQDLSAGYDWELKPEKGVWQGQPYDFVITKIHDNHVALVEQARVTGSRVADSRQGSSYFSLMTPYLKSKPSHLNNQKENNVSQTQDSAIARYVGGYVAPHFQQGAILDAEQITTHMGDHYRLTHGDARRLKDAIVHNDAHTIDRIAHHHNMHHDDINALHDMRLKHAHGHHDVHHGHHDTHHDAHSHHAAALHDMAAKHRLGQHDTPKLHDAVMTHNDAELVDQLADKHRLPQHVVDALHHMRQDIHGQDDDDTGMDSHIGLHDSLGLMDMMDNDDDDTGMDTHIGAHDALGLMDMMDDDDDGYGTTDDDDDHDVGLSQDDVEAIAADKAEQIFQDKLDEFKADAELEALESKDAEELAERAMGHVSDSVLKAPDARTKLKLVLDAKNALTPELEKASTEALRTIVKFIGDENIREYEAKYAPKPVMTFDSTLTVNPNLSREQKVEASYLRRP